MEVEEWFGEGGVGGGIRGGGEVGVGFGGVGEVGEGEVGGDAAHVFFLLAGFGLGIEIRTLRALELGFWMESEGAMVELKAMGWQWGLRTEIDGRAMNCGFGLGDIEVPRESCLWVVVR